MNLLGQAYGWAVGQSSTISTADSAASSVKTQKLMVKPDQETTDKEMLDHRQDQRDVPMRSHNTHQQAHVDPQYYRLVPWYGQDESDDPIFSVAWPFPHTIRAGMLHGLAVGQNVPSNGSHSHRDPANLDLETGPSSNDAGRTVDSRLEHHSRHANSEEAERADAVDQKDFIPPDVRPPKFRPTPRVPSEEKHVSAKGSPQDDSQRADIRRSSQRDRRARPLWRYGRRRRSVARQAAIYKEDPSERMGRAPKLVGATEGETP